MYQLCTHNTAVMLSYTCVSSFLSPSSPNLLCFDSSIKHTISQDKRHTFLEVVFYMHFMLCLISLVLIFLIKKWLHGSHSLVFTSRCSFLLWPLEDTVSSTIEVLALSRHFEPAASSSHNIQQRNGSLMSIIKKSRYKYITHTFQSRQIKLNQHAWNPLNVQLCYQRKCMFAIFLRLDIYWLILTIYTCLHFHFYKLIIHFSDLFQI